MIKSATSAYPKFNNKQSLITENQTVSTLFEKLFKKKLAADLNFPAITKVVNKKLDKFMVQSFEQKTDVIAFSVLFKQEHNKYVKNNNSIYKILVTPNLFTGEVVSKLKDKIDLFQPTVEQIYAEFFVNLEKAEIYDYINEKKYLAELLLLCVKKFNRMKYLNLLEKIQKFEIGNSQSLHIIYLISNFNEVGDSKFKKKSLWTLYHTVLDQVKDNEFINIEKFLKQISFEIFIHVLSDYYLNNKDAYLSFENLFFDRLLDFMTDEKQTQEYQKKVLQKLFINEEQILKFFLAKKNRRGVESCFKFFVYHISFISKKNLVNLILTVKTTFMVQHLSSRLFKMQRSIGSPFREAHFVAILQSSLSLTKFYRMIKWSDPAILSAGIPLMNFNQLQILLARARRRLNDYDAFCSYLNSKPRNEVVGYAAYERKFGFDSHISNFFYHLFVKMRAQDTTVNDDYLRHAFGFDFKEMGDLKFNFQLITKMIEYSKFVSAQKKIKFCSRFKESGYQYHKKNLGEVYYFCHKFVRSSDPEFVIKVAEHASLKILQMGWPLIEKKAQNIILKQRPKDKEALKFFSLARLELAAISESYKLQTFFQNLSSEDRLNLLGSFEFENRSDIIKNLESMPPEAAVFIYSKFGLWDEFVKNLKFEQFLAIYPLLNSLEKENIKSYLLPTQQGYFNKLSKLGL